MSVFSFSSLGLQGTLVGAIFVVLRMIMAAARAIPAPVAWTVGHQLGYMLSALPLRDKRRAVTHLAQAFPEKSPSWHHQTARLVFAHFVAMALETLTSLDREQRQLFRMVTYSGRAAAEDLLRAAVRKKGTVCYTGHFGNWEIMCRISGLIVPTAVIGRRLRHPGLDGLIKDVRTGTGAIQIDQQDGPRPCVRALREGRLLACLSDQDIPALRGTFVPWFGRLANTPTGPAMLAWMAEVEVQPIFCLRHHGRWCIHFGPRRALRRELGREAATEEITAWATAYQEEWVRRYPQQWVWWHKRWRTRPANETPTLAPGH